jgi:S1-C subfamily serine protease
MSIKSLTAAAAAAGVAVTGGLLVAKRTPAAPPIAIEAPAEAPAQRPAAPGVQGVLPDLSIVAERALKSAANITSTRLVRTDPLTQFMTGQLSRRDQSLGSGVVVDASGIVLTNTHVIGEDPQAQVLVGLPDRPDQPGRVIGIDSVSDVAVIQIEGRNLQTLPWGDSSQLRIAEWVLAIGNPYQLSGTVTLGIVSTINRSGAEVGAITDFIQTDAAINPGNSGGALVNQRGELVGINTLVISQTGGYEGIGFAIPSNTARRIMKELIDHGEVRWGSLGRVQWLNVGRERARAAGRGDAAGVLVYVIDPNSSAYRAGLREEDLVVAIDGRPVTDASQLSREIITASVGKTVKLDVMRDGPRRVSISVPVVSRESSPGRRGRG